MIDELLAAAVEQSMGVYGPLAPDAAVRLAVELAMTRAGSLAIAVPTADALLEALDVRAALVAAEATLLEADDPEWSASIGAAGAGITGATMAVAATATLVLPCGPGRPRGTHIVPPAHVCLLRAATVVATLDDALALIASAGGSGAAGLPSNVSWVSGPSRTADLEMRRTLGVHGPKSVDLIVIDG